ncbi:MAG: cupin domain-containing protein [Verrucomicrobia bacterium]|nr:cupin domain-containing protein [Verrucomicrobiota bacterium]
MSYSTLATLPARNLFPGVAGRYVHEARFTIGHVALAAGAVVPIHQHPHDQISYVLEGRLEFTVGAETRVMEPGMCLIIPGGTPHGCRALTACGVLDTFTPVREDYR